MLKIKKFKDLYYLSKNDKPVKIEMGKNSFITISGRSDSECIENAMTLLEYLLNEKYRRSPK